MAISLMVIGAILLVGLLLPGKGALTDGIRNVIAPWFGTGRWLLPLLLLGGGWYVEWGPGKRPGSGWGRTLVGLGVAYLSLLGLLAVLEDAGLADGRSGGQIGEGLAGFLGGLLSPAGAFVVLAALLVLGVVFALNVGMRELFSPIGRAARGLGGALAAPAAGAAAAAAGPRHEPAAGENGRSREGAGVRNGRAARDASRPDIPVPLPSPAPVSSVFGGAAPTDAAVAAAAAASSASAAAGRAGDVEGSGAGTAADGLGGAAEPTPRQPRDYTLPPTSLL
ncbi:MAG: DNA translocase FtsK 4TM domain-containing protein, partial [Chloroflexi bacterium]|nr:DNA translocase FtsK 4TM domain-containing protein [Chloroflexota bacterium]